jgi:hypothetical protein
MRKANVNDMFNVARLIRDLDLRENIFVSQQGEEDIEKIGFNIVFDILSKATTKESQNKIYECLSGPYEKTVKEIGQMPYMELVESFTECFDLVTLKNFMERVNK